VIEMDTTPLAVLVALPLSGALVVKVVRSERRRRKPWGRASETLSHGGSYLVAPVVYHPRDEAGAEGAGNTPTT
jgi:hypothetical protein